MKKKIFLIISLLFFFSTNVVVKADDSSMSGSAGTHDQEDFTKNFSKGMTNEQNGLRLTVIDIQGNQISDNVVDYWESGTPTGATMLSGSNFKTYIVNHKGLRYEVKPSATYNYKQGDPQNIKGAGMSTWESKHLQLEDMISDVEPGDKCVNPAFLDELGYDLCKALEDDCEALEKTYILVEPLMLTHLIENHSVKYVFSGTEYSFYLNNFKNEGKLVDYNGSMVPEGEKIIRSQIGGAMWRELVNMRLSCFSDDDCTWGLKSGSSRYAYMPSKISTNAFANPLSAHAGYSRDANNNVYGTSMHLVWFGKLKDKCDESCCVPCGDDTSDPEVLKCIEEAGDNYHEDDPFCCYTSSKIMEEDECVDSDEYWSTREEFFENYCEPKCEIPPGGPDTYCCDDPEWQKANPGLFEELCLEEHECGMPILKPEILISQCDTDDEPNISYFRDGVFSSNGQFSQYNTLEKIEEQINGPYLPMEWVNKIANEEGDGTFLALAYSEDVLHTIPLNDYCTVYCQEIFEVNLPENYPVAQAGRWFKWTIADSEDIIAMAGGGKLCATDINLDKIINDYNNYNSAAESAATAAANMHCGSLPYYGLKDANGAYTCGQYAEEAKEIGVCCSIKCKLWGTKEISYDCPTINEPNKVCYTTVPDCKLYETEAEAEERCYSEHMSKCSRISNNYQANVVGYAAKVSGLVNSWEQCNGSSEQVVNIGTEIELEYETLFGPHTYSTIDETIEKNVLGGRNAGNFGCIDEEDEGCNTEDKFKLNNRGDELGKNNPIKCSDVSCVPWNEYEYDEPSGGADLGSAVENVVTPNEQENSLYACGGVLQFVEGVNGYDRTSNQFIGGTLVNYPMSAWNSITIGYVSNHALYELDKKINACICKDGVVKDMTANGECECEEDVEHMDYDEFISTYNNYQTMPDGTLSVEFMNGTGLYPISLKYWIIGDVENGTGHFDSSLDMYCPNNQCVYGDPNGVCRFVITNKIIATPDDICEDDDCEPDPDICEGDDCDSEPIIPDLGDCIVDGTPVEECGNVAGLNVVYRVVDLDNPFPGIDGDGRTLPENSNWYDKEYIIKQNRGVAGNALYTSNITPLYSSTLTPAVIKAIRADNERLSPDYLAGTVIYPSDSPGIKGGGYSLFVHNFIFNGNQVISSTIDDVNSPTPKEETDYDWSSQFENILDTAATVGGDI